jgi:hypothetical protein
MEENKKAGNEKRKKKNERNNIRRGRILEDVELRRDDGK